MPRPATRRSFLKAASALAFPTVIPASALGADGRPAPSNRITVGFIGLGGEGLGKDVRAFLAQPEIHALAACDVDFSRREQGKHVVEQKYAKEKAAGTYKGCAAYNDFREVVERKDIDAVVIATPDHWHVPISVMAAKAGKDVFCEKPLTVTVREGRVLSDTVRRYGRVFQTASEFRATGSFLRAAELVRNGRLGRVHTVNTWLPPGHNVLGNPSFEFVDPPKGFDYDMWLGPAPWAPYCPARCHFNYRWISDYSGGHITDWGAHLNDVAQWALGHDLSGPTAVEGTGQFPAEGLYDTALHWTIHYTYPNGTQLVCRDGRPAIEFVGDRGRIHLYYGQPMTCEPASLKDETFGPDDVRLQTAPSEFRSFIDSVRSRRPTYNTAEQGHRTATVCHLGNIALAVGRKLAWDPETERFTNDDGANRLLSRAMRGAWTI